ncbi:MULTISPECIES: radical SAM protein [Methanothrix]|jgi:uncharacterized protein|uniref:Radical SAM domain protein n=1 Tax=Methanothrix soehngenii (strain ATCC 5969 / DSM 3671 / JCM 10134 / NBRC 103675 / OCM 69 / GP-6) TaxID=990316 RepID=F4BWC8_METSG|nr:MULTISPECIES: radical SAM protein [Methanothrix]AEB69738.1 radical SAM domain protein [Methanothrix soehngenii GP6]MDD3552001.1 radical SAM protein [Methanothrix soehngenii]MDY0412401.1 radical SAM protein [Methanothrix soehngenii]HOE46823.1 radical SAM protein [Methanothrix soehngenii]HPL21941.1 radical SAM protein [Methanothrix soehngenii]
MLEFQSPIGNAYAWDDETGIFIPFSPTMKAVFEALNRKSLSLDDIVFHLSDKFSKEDLIFCYNWLKKWGKIRPMKQKSSTSYKPSTSEVRSLLLRTGFTQLTLSVTEDCNFRCKYCAFSDLYEYTRSQSNKYMKSDTAKRAIDYYFSLLKEGARYNPKRQPALAFYGGEPLLNFNLIKICVEHIENEYGNCKTRYTLTTNGSLLDKEKANWLMEHDFSIAVSLDGPEEEHNRLRVYPNGKGTFREVMGNVTSILKTGYTKIYCLPVIDWKSDLFKREEFFSGKDTPPVSFASLVSNEPGSGYFDQFTEEDHHAFLEQLKNAKKSYSMNLDHQKQRDKLTLFDYLIGQYLKNIIFNGISIYSPHPLMPFSSACIPGRKIFVDVDGNFHICEKINSFFPIGNVNEGLNFENICELLSNYISSMDKCPSCKVRRNCSQCYPKFAMNGLFLCSSEVCREMEVIMKKAFAEAFAVAEIDPQFIEKEINSKKANTKKYYGD